MITPRFEVIGFTGTKDGLRVPQMDALAELFARIPYVRELHHGDCVGADDMAHMIADSIGWRIVVHPPLNQNRAVGHLGALRLPPKDFLVRNQDIVDAAELLVACPGELTEQLRSGTWSTVRKARIKRIPIGLVFPNGTVRWERPDLSKTQLAHSG